MYKALLSVGFTQRAENPGAKPPANSGGSGLAVCPGQYEMLRLNERTSSQQDPRIADQQERAFVRTQVATSVDQLHFVGGMGEARRKQMRIACGEIELDQPSRHYVQYLDRGTSGGGVVDVIQTACMVVLNEGGGRSYPECAPDVSLGHTANPHKHSLDFLMGWICILSVNCKESCSVGRMIGTLFDDSSYSGINALEGKFVDFWYLVCFVVSVQRFVLVHIVGGENGDGCKLKFVEPEARIQPGDTLSDLLFGSASLIASRAYVAFTKSNMEAGRGVLDRFTDEVLKQLACSYCTAAGIASGADWDGARTYFRSLMGEPTLAPAPRKKGKVDPAAVENTKAVMELLLCASSRVQEA
jgi:hypothetical protein